MSEIEDTQTCLQGKFARCSLTWHSIKSTNCSEWKLLILLLVIEDGLENHSKSCVPFRYGNDNEARINQVRRKRHCTVKSMKFKYKCQLRKTFILSRVVFLSYIVPLMNPFNLMTWRCHNQNIQGAGGGCRNRILCFKLPI